MKQKAVESRTSGESPEGLNKTPEAKKALAEALVLARLTGDRFTTSMLEQGLVDFDPQPVYVPIICDHCGYEVAPMVGCYCDLKASEI